MIIIEGSFISSFSYNVPAQSYQSSYPKRTVSVQSSTVKSSNPTFLSISDNPHKTILRLVSSELPSPSFCLIQQDLDDDFHSHSPYV